jgi:response regulator NasT
MTSKETKGQLLYEVEQSGARAGTVAIDSWRTQVLVLASDNERAGRVIAGLNGRSYRTEISDSGVWESGRLRLVGAGLIVLASPEADIALLENILTMRRFQSVPIIVFVDRGSREDMMRALKLGVSAFIVDGLKPERIPAIIDVAAERHALTMGLLGELQKSKEDLAARKTIEKAKGLLMLKSGLSEQDVYHSMRRLAMAEGKPMREIADAVLAIFAIFP